MTASTADRVGRLRAAAQAVLAASGCHMIVDEAEQAACIDVAARSYAATPGQPEVCRRAAYLRAFAEEMPVSIVDDEPFVGSGRFNPGYRALVHRFGSAAAAAFPLARNNGHIVVDYGRVLTRGVAGLQADVAAMAPVDAIAQQNQQAFAESLSALAHFIARHGTAARAAGRSDLGAVCAHLVQAPPRTFREALQLIWFVQIFLHAEGWSVAVSFGRFDQYAGPYLERDLQTGVLDRPAAAELLSCFFLKCCEGDESQNLLLGGVDGAGRPAENALSLLCLEVASRLEVWQPSLTVCLEPGSSEAFWQAALKLAACGVGQPSFLNGPVVAQALETAGVPPDRARDIAVVGCYEATPQGDTYGLTVNGQLSLPQVLRDFLAGVGTAPASFAALVDTFLKHLAETCRCAAVEWQAEWDRRAATTPSPFESVCLTGCLDSGRAAEEGGAAHNLFGVNVLGFGTTVDSLVAIREVVYTRGDLSLRALVAALETDYPDAALQQALRSVRGRYGTDDAASNGLARQLAATLAEAVLAIRLRGGVRPVPGLFRFGGDVRLCHPATPDGRRAGERLSYGAGPSVLAEGATPTTILQSVAAVPHHRFACGNPLLLSFPPQELRGRACQTRLRHLIKTYFAAGGFQLHVNAVDAEHLRAAQEEPAGHAELTVRISGYSARFTQLDRVWQDALIERTERGQ